MFLKSREFHATSLYTHLQEYVFGICNVLFIGYMVEYGPKWADPEETSAVQRRPPLLSVAQDRFPFRILNLCCAHTSVTFRGSQQYGTKNYCTNDPELCAIVLAIPKFRHELDGTKVIARTDCNPSPYVTIQTELTKRQTQFVCALWPAALPLSKTSAPVLTLHYALSRAQLWGYPLNESKPSPNASIKGSI